MRAVSNHRLLSGYVATEQTSNLINGHYVRRSGSWSFRPGIEKFYLLVCRAGAIRTLYSHHEPLIRFRSANNRMRKPASTATAKLRWEQEKAIATLA